jgi:lipopolysaccharide/colanic/teichoic acid biosynthesis glycosyltransferase
VLKGEMSIVGPRPEREHFINVLKEKIPKYMERHRVKCGITGWAQVNGLRGSDTSLEKRIEYDIYYVEHWSIVFDMKIIIKTLKEMFLSKAAF